MRNNAWTWIGLAGLAVTAVVLFLSLEYPGTLAIEENRMRAVYLVLLLTMVGGSVMVGWRERAGLALKQALIWIAIGLGLVTVYSFRGEFETIAMQVTGELAPSRPIETEPGVVTLRAGNDGHFHVDALVNGTHLRLMVDTGASDVALTEGDARRLGIDLSQLRFDRIYVTANGRVPGARVVLDEISIGSVTARNVEASITQGGGLEQSLLGMSFLRQLSSVNFDGDRLTLRE